MDEQQQAAIDRVRLVQKSGEVARRVASSRADSSKVAVRLMQRGVTPAHEGDPVVWREDNDCHSAQVQGRVVRDALSECLEPLADGGLIGGVIPSALSSLIFAAYDAESKCPVERLPQPRVSVVRLLAHVEALGLSIPPALAARVARRATLVLLNHVKSRRPVVAPTDPEPRPSPLPEAEPDRQRVSRVEQQDAATVDSPSARAGRQVRGYARVSSVITWAQGTTETPIGAVVEVLVPDERDREAVARDEVRGAPSIVIWWEGRARIVPRSAMSPVSRAAWSAWIKENGS